jgi:hypothetical protein
MANIDIDQLIEDLRTGERTIKFRKNDGTIRFLRATLRQGAVPQPKGTKTTAVNPDVVVAFDVENQGWRSFRKDAVLDVLV